MQELYSVYHWMDLSELSVLAPAEKLWLCQRDHYLKVAEVTVDSLDEVFRLTNHILGDWRDNPEVRVLVEHAVRSTSVGDVIVRGDVAWLVEPFGFSEVQHG